MRQGLGAGIGVRANAGAGIGAGIGVRANAGAEIGARIGVQANAGERAREGTGEIRGRIGRGI